MHKSHRLMPAATLVFSGVAASRAAPVGGVAGELVSKAHAVAWEWVALRRCAAARAIVVPIAEGKPTALATAYYVHDADKLSIGTQRRWDQMQRENRTGGAGRN